ncbi:erythromycin esterase family protein [Deinococcus peraridilitoris]|uniref:Erythromycin esterase-like enzyme n=1 Tax=Deinococcus peraridilitoris (strain DSM 19664 / LMG 22246 / CIP 109416 / KR-200) TaxID=937777 RepID=L0A3F1_DEIPD|nr:erythromycin esterase family protein [Deinococcus peraridilitoris]AFZ67697.1 erythromycin esterase-like enzyme [Deinococcus peraridilitoris DSM 19664]
MTVKSWLLSAALTLSVTTSAAPPPASTLAGAVRAAAVPVTDDPRSFDALVQLARGATYVLLGEASHGTHEFYHARAEITRRLIKEHGFDAVVIEGDWPDAQRVNRFVRGEGSDRTAELALGNFERFPRWLWRNTVVRDFTTWLRAHNDGRQNTARAGFYGMDLYSLASSRREVLRAFETLDPARAERVRAQYACLGAFGADLQDNRGAPATGNAQACEQTVQNVFTDLQRFADERRGRPGTSAEALFDLVQNARLVKNAVAYERTAGNIFGGASSWNVRDQHMFETLEAIRTHLGKDARIVVWAHNSHLGDARATEMGRGGELNVGQLVRQRHGQAALLVGFTTHTGSVTAAQAWDAPAQRMQVRPSLEGSYERLFHDTGLPNFLLDLRRAPQGLQQERLERAIGVQYLPASERQSHYFRANLPRQFDAVVHFDETRALEPLDPAAR